MHSFLRSVFIVRLVLGSVLFIFPITSVEPRYGITFDIPGWDETNSLLKIKKIVSKIKKAVKYEDADEAFKALFSLKKEAEEVLGKKINLEDYLKKLPGEVDCKISKQHLELYKKNLKTKTSKIKHREKCLAYGYTIEESDILFYSTKAGQEERFQEQLPLQVQIGITVCLCGLLIAVLPLPGCQGMGGAMIASGGELLIYYYADRKSNER